jgi:hypothetical protein
MADNIGKTFGDPEPQIFIIDASKKPSPRPRPPQLCEREPLSPWVWRAVIGLAIAAALLAGLVLGRWVLP